MVHSINDEKESLLRQRREKLTRWKQKKQDGIIEESKIVKDDDKLSKRKAKLEEWKKRKQSQDHHKEIIQKKKQYKKKRSLFEESDEEESILKVKLFKPGDDENNSKKDLEKCIILDNGEDSLDMFMKSISVDLSDKKRSIHIFDDTDNFDDLSVNEFKNNDTNSDLIRLAKFKSKKFLKQVQYSQNDLENLTKNLYCEPKEIQEMTEEDVNNLRLSLDNIKIKGLKCPRPILKWSQLGLSSGIMSLISNQLGYKSPTPIQSQAIPAIMSGRDVMGISKTGSGKTIAFLLPLIRQIKSQRPLDIYETGPIGLVLAPTRELALQIYEEIVKFTESDNQIRSMCCTGGYELKKQINDFKRGIEVLIATPGRFIDLLSLNGGKLINPHRISYVVMDEADRLFDLGFEPQITQIMKCIRPDKQCVLFSATFPAKLKIFASKILSNPIQITINSKSLINENIEQQVKIFESDELKFQGLLDILNLRLNEKISGKDEKLIIFVSSQQICDLLYNKLLMYGYNICAIHAGKTASERSSNLKSFKDSSDSILLCTEILSRGLNVPEVSLVIIYNAVKTFAQYVHTTGRTARGANKGIALTLLLPDELSAAYILTKSMRENELKLLKESTLLKLKDMSNSFSEGMKSGKYRLTKGFGGKGLEHLHKLTEEKQTEEIKQYGSDGPLIKELNEENQNEEIASIVIPKLDYSINMNIASDGITTYSAHVNINDLPQTVRWEATKNTTLSSIKHETGCSITTKGKFYPDNQEPRSEKDESKLYLLVESSSDKDIQIAIQLLEDKVKEGIRKSNMLEIKSNKY